MKKFLKEKIGTIIFLIIVIILVGAGYLSINKAKENAITYKTDYEAPESNIDTTSEGEYKSVAKSEHTELLFNSVLGTIWVKNLDNGYIWKGVCDNDDYDLSSLGKKWKAYLQSAITITYNDLKKRDASPTKVYSATDAKWRSSELIENGVSVTYGFTKPGIFITVEYTLDGDELVVRVPYEKIEEKSRYAVTTMEVLPFIGAAKNEEDGYLLYPDGSGAITTFAKASTRPENVNVASYYTYSNKYMDYGNYYDDEVYDRYTAALPIFGIKRGNNAIFGAITEGEAASGVLVYPSGCNNVMINHAGFQIDLRNVFNVSQHSMSNGADTKATGSIIQRVDKNFIPESRELRYFFLSGDKANYSGMAEIYRSYLLENGKLQDVVNPGDELPLTLQLLCGASKEGMIFTQYVKMTSFDDVQDIVNSLNSKGIDSMNVVLNAWQSDAGLNNDNWPVAGKIGGKSSLKDLGEFSAGKSNLNIYLSQETTFVYDETKKLNETKDVVYNGLGIEVSNKFFDGTTGYLLNAQAAFDRNTYFLKKISGINDSIGVAYSSLGYYIYADGNEDHPFTKQAMIDKITDMMGSTVAEGRKVATAGTNQYIFAQSDFIYDLKEEAYGLLITDYSVPFAQMVLSGCVPYSTTGAGNLSYDLQYQKLKWIEYGAAPYFYLTKESALNLRETNYTDLFSSTYADWEDIMVSTYLEIKDNLGDAYSYSMISHEYLTDDLVRIEYENGVVVYINYGDVALSYRGVNIPANNYTVVRGGD